MQIYKILRPTEWADLDSKGETAGAPIDVADGFIHFSAGDQVAGTLGKHFAGRKALLLIAVDAARLGSDLHWEVSRAGALFPHLYAHLAIDAVADTRPIPDDHDLSGFADWGIEPEW